VLDFLAELDASYRAAKEGMLTLLQEVIPHSGPPRTLPLCKPLGFGLFELRKQPKGKKLRVVWFYGNGRTIICTTAFSKAERTPRTEIDRSRWLLKLFAEETRRGDVEIID
jgi:phage-related protein